VHKDPEAAEDARQKLHLDRELGLIYVAGNASTPKLAKQANLLHELRQMCTQLHCKVNVWEDLASNYTDLAELNPALLLGPSSKSLEELANMTRIAVIQIMAEPGGVSLQALDDRPTRVWQSEPPQLRVPAEIVGSHLVARLRDVLQAARHGLRAARAMAVSNAIRQGSIKF